MTARQYNGPEHESFIAVCRCLLLHRGQHDTDRLASGLLKQLGASSVFDLAPWGANYCRKALEKLLPMRGDFA